MQQSYDRVVAEDECASLERVQAVEREGEDDIHGFGLEELSLISPPKATVNNSSQTQSVGGALQTVISGAGFMSDAYDLFVINIAADIMSQESYHQPLTPATLALVKSAALIGAVFGQVVFGIFADHIGRKLVFLITGGCIIVGCLLSSLSINSDVLGIYSQLIMFRFILGFGVGGEYPLSATITSESSVDSNRATNLAAVFSMQGVGTILSSLVLVFATHTITSPDTQWRLALGFGAVPVVLTYYYRHSMGESREWQESNLEREQGGISRAETLRNTFRTHGKLLLGTAGAWMILDVVFYANGLFSGSVTKAMGIANGIKGEALQALVVQSIAFVGYIFTVAFVHRIGPKRLQIFGYMGTAAMFLLMAVLQRTLEAMGPLYVFVYGVSFFFQNFGPNATTYIIPSLVFPTESRATCHGISAASGKVGAILGAQLFLPLVNIYCPDQNCNHKQATNAERDQGLQLTFGVCALLAILGTIWSVMLVRDTPAHSHIMGANSDPNSPTLSVPAARRPPFELELTRRVV